MRINELARARAMWELTVLVLDKIPALNREQGIDNRQDAKLDAATHALVHLEHDNAEAAVLDLGVFANAVKAESGTRIPRASAYELNAWADELMTALGPSQSQDGNRIA